MPQMAPMMWMTLMMIFSSVSLMSMTMIYFNKSTQKKINSKNYSKKMNWMW